MNLQDKVVIVTGASSGLGAVTAEKLAEQGAKLVLVAHNEAKLAAVTDKIVRATEAIAVQVDLTDESAAAQIKNAALEKFGIIDILINNAGIWTDNELEKADPSRVAKAFAVNSVAPIRLTQEVLPYFEQQNAGYILNVISTGGASDTEAGNNENWMAYGATKWALSGFTIALTKKLAATPIHVTAFQPAGFESDLYENAGAKTGRAHNQPWMMKTEDVANALIFCLTQPQDVQIERLLVTKKRVN
jgi:short-subunit dehydrogenase